MSEFNLVSTKMVLTALDNNAFTNYPSLRKDVYSSLASKFGGYGYPKGLASFGWTLNPAERDAGLLDSTVSKEPTPAEYLKPEATQPQIRVQAEVDKTYRAFLAAQQQFKHELVVAAGTHIESLEDEVTGYAEVSIQSILDYLRTNFGTASDATLKGLFEVIHTTTFISKDIDVAMAPMERARRQLLLANAPVSDFEYLCNVQRAAASVPELAATIAAYFQQHSDRSTRTIEAFMKFVREKVMYFPSSTPSPHSYAGAIVPVPASAAVAPPPARVKCTDYYCVIHNMCNHPSKDCTWVKSQLAQNPKRYTAAELVATVAPNKK